MNAFVRVLVEGSVVIVYSIGAVLAGWYGIGVSVSKQVGNCGAFGIVMLMGFGGLTAFFAVLIANLSIVGRCRKEGATLARELLYQTKTTITILVVVIGLFISFVWIPHLLPGHKCQLWSP